MKKKKIKVKGYAVFGEWGFVGAFQYKSRAKEEAERVRKIGWGAQIIKVHITKV